MICNLTDLEIHLMSCGARFSDSWIRDIEEALKYKRDSQWQPIETAPRDGTPLILFSGGVVGCGQYLISEISYSIPNGWEGWQFMSPVHRDRYCFDPTHWMPYPQPPEEKT